MITGDFALRREEVATAMRHLDKVSEGEQLWIKARNDFYGTGDDSQELPFLKS